MRAFWHNASGFQLAFSPFGNGLECGRTFELLALGCIVVMPPFPGSEEEYSGLPVAFLPPASRRRKKSDQDLAQRRLGDAAQARERRERRLRLGERRRSEASAAAAESAAALARSPLEAVTRPWLEEVVARLGPLARDVAGTRRKLGPGYWADRVREPLRRLERQHKDEGENQMLLKRGEGREDEEYAVAAKQAHARKISRAVSSHGALSFGGGAMSNAAEETQGRPGPGCRKGRCERDPMWD